MIKQDSQSGPKLHKGERVHFQTNHYFNKYETQYCISIVHVTEIMPYPASLSHVHKALKKAYYALITILYAMREAVTTYN